MLELMRDDATLERWSHKALNNFWGCGAVELKSCWGCGEKVRPGKDAGALE